MSLHPDHPTPSADELLDALPYGLVVLTQDGTILRENVAARELVPGLGTDAVRRCSDLFSCQVPGGPCEHGCFVARVAEERRPAPEVRIDAANGVPTGALWITASAMPAGTTLLHLRPGWRGDRRRRSEEQWYKQPQLRILALGRTQIESADDSVTGDWLSQRPGQILKYLVCERERVVMAEEIAEAIWPDTGRRAVANTRYAIHRLRLQLEPRRNPREDPAFVVSRAGGYALDRDRIWIDIDEFERAIDEGRAAMLRLDTTAAAWHLTHAVNLYRGPLVADEPYADWADDERLRLAGLAANALRVLSALAYESGDGDAAVGHLQRLAELEPLDSSVHRELVRALLGQGRRSEAKRRYDTFARRLWRELGQEMEFTLRALAAEPTQRSPSSPPPPGAT